MNISVAYISAVGKKYLPNQNRQPETSEPDESVALS